MKLKSGNEYCKFAGSSSLVSFLLFFQLFNSIPIKLAAVHAIFVVPDTKAIRVYNQTIKPAIEQKAQTTNGGIVEAYVKNVTYSHVTVKNTKPPTKLIKKFGAQRSMTNSVIVTDLKTKFCVFYRFINPKHEQDFK